MKANSDQRIRDIQHFGEEGGVVPVIDLASTSTFLNPEEMEATFAGKKEGCYLYSRHSNPTVNMFSIKMAAFEDTEAALGVSSGIAAISATIEQLTLKQRQGGKRAEVLSALTVYGGTYALFKNIFPAQGIDIKFVDMNNLDEVEKAITSVTQVIYVETLSNPLLSVSPLRKLSQLAKKYNLKLVVDNTFAPGLVTPSHWGADVVLHSCTKFISGASDMIAGVICGTKDFINSLIDLNHGTVMLKGPTMDPRIAYELYVRMDHLPIRIKAHSEAAQFFSKKMLEEKIPVIYPGLTQHPHHQEFIEIANPEYGFGGMISIEIDSPQKAMLLARKLQEVQFGLYAVSLGFSRTLLTVPSVTTSSEITTEDQTKMKLTPGLLRMSVGYSGDLNTMWDRFIKSYREIVG